MPLPSIGDLTKQFREQFELDPNNPEDNTFLRNLIQAVTHSEILGNKLEGNGRWTDLADAGKLKGKEIEH